MVVTRGSSVSAAETYTLAMACYYLGRHFLGRNTTAGCTVWKSRPCQTAGCFNSPMKIKSHRTTPHMKRCGYSPDILPSLSYPSVKQILVRSWSAKESISSNTLTSLAATTTNPINISLLVVSNIFIALCKVIGWNEQALQ